MYPLAQINRFRNVFGGPQQNTAPAPIQFVPPTQAPTIPTNMLPPQGNNIQNVQGTSNNVQGTPGAIQNLPVQLQPAQLAPTQLPLPAPVGNITPPNFMLRPDITQGSPIPTPAPSPNILPPDGPATTAYKDFLASGPPNRDDYQPSKLDRLQASLSGIAAGARGQNGAAVGRDILDDKFNEANAAFGNKAKLLSAGAGLEADQTKNELAAEKVQNETLKATSGAKNTDSLIASRTAKTALAAASAANPNLIWKSVPGGNIIGFDKKGGKPVDSGIASGDIDAATKQQYKIEQIDETGKNNIAAAGVKNEQTLAREKDMLDYRNENPAITSATRTMMEGAQMLRPHVPEIRDLATKLNDAGLMGPVMSRIRNAAAKIGTTGTPEEVQKSTEDFRDAIGADPSLNKDALVGEFTTMLGLLASGAGRVHGGAKGGSSIQMINYMKELLSSDGTLTMFNQRLNGLDRFLKTYADGPQKANSSDKKTPGNTNAKEPPTDGSDFLGVLGGKK